MYMRIQLVASPSIHRHEGRGYVAANQLHIRNQSALHLR